jgi:hypothetical protein
MLFWLYKTTMGLHMWKFIRCFSFNPKILSTMLECVFVTNWALGENGVHGSLVLVTSMAR